MTLDRDDRRALVALSAIALVALVVRVAALPASGFASDVGTFVAWAERLAAVGPWGFYEPGYFSDYPPALLYVLWVLGGLLDGGALGAAVKAISVPFDFAIAAVVAALLWRSAGRMVAVSAAAMWLLAPGIIFAGPFWGQVDAVGTLPFLLALIAAGRSRWLTAGMLAALAAMIKPQFGLALIVVGAAAAIELARTRDGRPLFRVAAAAAATILLLGLPFRAGPGELIALVRGASETYPYTSLYAFNVWGVVADFWTRDDSFFAIGAVLLAAGIAASCVPLWRRRDVPTLLFAGGCAALAFYFLPTRAHERYLFPAFALLLPFAATNMRALWPYVVLALGFLFTLLAVFATYALIDVPGPLADLLQSRGGEIALCLVMIGAAVTLVASILRRGISLGVAPSPPAAERVAPSPRRWSLPAALRPGRAPTRRDYVVALAVALLVLVSRGYRLDQPRDMYFDEVYHARTAFELLAQREPYEWTHPHLAKELMALGILAFGGDRVVGRESTPSGVTAFAATNDGGRVYGLADGRIVLIDRGGAMRELRRVDSVPSAVAVDGDRVAVIAESGLFLDGSPTRFMLQGEPLAIAAARDRVFVGMSTATLISPPDGAPIVVQVPAVAIAVKGDGSEIYLLGPDGSVTVVDPSNGQTTRSFPGQAPATAIAHLQGPNRLFLARADQPVLEVIELESARRDVVPLANARTGVFASGATALAAVPRTQFLYALADERLVVIEPHGASPYAAIPTAASRLAVDGTADKLLLQGSEGLELIETGAHALAWRLPGLLFGALLAFFLVLLARRLFAGAFVPIFAGVIVLLDGSMFAQPRIGMNDVYVAALLVMAWYFVVAAHAPRRWAWLDLVIAGLCFGLALSAKWVAAYALVALALATLFMTARAFERGEGGRGGPLDLLRGRGANALFLLVAFGALPIGVYLLAYLPWFGGPMMPYGWAFTELTQQMYWYHSGLTSPHPAGSPWWTWPLVLKPVYWYFGASGGDTAVIYDAGNVVLFWGALAATVWCAVAAVRTRSLALGFVVFALAAQIVAWVPITRVLFFYHFFTALPYYLLALAAALAALWEDGRRGLVGGYLVLAAAVFAFFYPFVSGLPVPADEAAVYFILPTWQYGCQFYPTFTCDLGPIAVGLDDVLARLWLPAAAGAALAIWWQPISARVRAAAAARRAR